MFDVCNLNYNHCFRACNTMRRSAVNIPGEIPKKGPGFVNLVSAAFLRKSIHIVVWGDLESNVYL